MLRTGRRQRQGSDAKTNQQLRFVFSATGKNDHLSGHGCQSSDENQFDLNDMAPQVTRDVLKHLKGDENSEQIPQNLDEVIPKPSGFRSLQKVESHGHNQLDQGSDDDDSGDHRQDARDNTLSGINN